MLLTACTYGPEIDGTFDVSFVWTDSKLQSAKVRAQGPARSPSPSQLKTIAKLSESYVIENVRAANLKRAAGVARLQIIGSPPYLMRVASFDITEPDFSELKAAVEHEDTSKVRALAMRYGNVNQRELPSQQTALAVAAAGRHYTSVRILLELGADVNSVDRIGVTPLMNAVLAGDLTTAAAARPQLHPMVTRASDPECQHQWVTSPHWAGYER
jgi:hypothetical protein